MGVIKKNLKVEIFSSAFKKVFKGKIESVSSRVDPSTRSILARVIVNNNRYEIIPGQLMTVRVIYNEQKQLGVPESAVTVQGKTSFVYVVNNDVAERNDLSKLEKGILAKSQFCQELVRRISNLRRSI